MSELTFNEGVKPGGLTSGTEIRILLCYLLDNIPGAVSRTQLEEALLGEALVNYFALAESLAQLREQALVAGPDDALEITKAGRTVGRTLAHDVPRTVREAAVRGLIRAQQYAAKAAAHHSEILQLESGRAVACSIQDGSGQLFQMQLYMPDTLTAEAVREKFIESGDVIYKLVLAALTGDKRLAQQSLGQLDETEGKAL
ncbi:MAG: DUF4364 family protein [Ruminococcaceae bacterium]|nr:DUF4364 family protein [Oscillospiraceae bacterium]